MGKEYSKSATERGQFMIADAIRKLSGSYEDDNIKLREFNKDATEYGQKEIVDAIKELGSGDGFVGNGSKIKVNVMQSENQTITYTIGGGRTSRFYTEGGIDATSEDGLSEGGDFYEAFLLNIKITSEDGYQYGNISFGGDGVIPSSFSIVNVGDKEISYNIYCFAGRTINLSATPATLV